MHASPVSSGPLPPLYARSQVLVASPFARRTGPNTGGVTPKPPPPFCCIEPPVPVPTVCARARAPLGPSPLPSLGRSSPFNHLALLNLSSLFCLCFSLSHHAHSLVTHSLPLYHTPSRLPPPPLQRSTMFAQLALLALPLLAGEFACCKQSTRMDGQPGETHVLTTCLFSICSSSSFLVPPACTRTRTRRAND